MRRIEIKRVAIVVLGSFLNTTYLYAFEGSHTKQRPSQALMRAEESIVKSIENKFLGSGLDSFRVKGKRLSVSEIREIQEGVRSIRSCLLEESDTQMREYWLESLQVVDQGASREDGGLNWVLPSSKHLEAPAYENSKCDRVKDLFTFLVGEGNATWSFANPFSWLPIGLISAVQAPSSPSQRRSGPILDEVLIPAYAHARMSDGDAAGYAFMDRKKHILGKTEQERIATLRDIYLDVARAKEQFREALAHKPDSRNPIRLESHFKHPLSKEWMDSLRVSKEIRDLYNGTSVADPVEKALKVIHVLLKQIPGRKGAYYNTASDIFGVFSASSEAEFRQSLIDDASKRTHPFRLDSMRDNYREMSRSPHLKEAFAPFWGQEAFSEDPNDLIQKMPELAILLGHHTNSPEARIAQLMTDNHMTEAEARKMVTREVAAGIPEALNRAGHFGGYGEETDTNPISPWLRKELAAELVKKNPDPKKLADLLRQAKQEIETADTDPHIKMAAFQGIHDVLAAVSTLIPRENKEVRALLAIGKTAMVVAMASLAALGPVGWVAAIVVAIIQLFNELQNIFSGGKPSDELILEELHKLKEQIQGLKNYVGNRFDKIETMMELMEQSLRSDLAHTRAAISQEIYRLHDSMLQAHESIQQTRDESVAQEYRTRASKAETQDIKLIKQLNILQDTVHSRNIDPSKVSDLLTEAHTAVSTHPWTINEAGSSLVGQVESEQDRQTNFAADNRNINADFEALISGANLPKPQFPELKSSTIKIGACSLANPDSVFRYASHYIESAATVCYSNAPTTNLIEASKQLVDSFADATRKVTLGGLRSKKDRAIIGLLQHDPKNERLEETIARIQKQSDLHKLYIPLTTEGHDPINFARAGKYFLDSISDAADRVSTTLTPGNVMDRGRGLLHDPRTPAKDLWSEFEGRVRPEGDVPTAISVNAAFAFPNRLTSCHDTDYLDENGHSLSFPSFGANEIAPFLGRLVAEEPKLLFSLEPGSTVRWCFSGVRYCESHRKFNRYVQAGQQRLEVEYFGNACFDVEAQVRGANPKDSYTAYKQTIKTDDSYVFKRENFKPFFSSVNGRDLLTPPTGNDETSRESRKLFEGAVSETPKASSGIPFAGFVYDATGYDESKNAKGTFDKIFLRWNARDSELKKQLQNASRVIRNPLEVGSALHMVDIKDLHLNERNSDTQIRLFAVEKALKKIRLQANSEIEWIKKLGESGLSEIGNLRNEVDARRRRFIHFCETVISPSDVDREELLKLCHNLPTGNQVFSEADQLFDATQASALMKKYSSSVAKILEKIAEESKPFRGNIILEDSVKKLKAVKALKAHFGANTVSTGKDVQEILLDGRALKAWKPLLAHSELRDDLDTLVEMKDNLERIFEEENVPEISAGHIVKVAEFLSAMKDIEETINGIHLKEFKALTGSANNAGAPGKALGNKVQTIILSRLKSGLAVSKEDALAIYELFKESHNVSNQNSASQSVVEVLAALDSPDIHNTPNGIRKAIGDALEKRRSVKNVELAKVEALRNAVEVEANREKGAKNKMEELLGDVTRDGDGSSFEGLGRPNKNELRKLNEIQDEIIRIIGYNEQGYLESAAIAANPTIPTAQKIKGLDDWFVVIETRSSKIRKYLAEAEELRKKSGEICHQYRSAVKKYTVDRTNSSLRSRLKVPDPDAGSW